MNLYCKASILSLLAALASGCSSLDYNSSEVPHKPKLKVIEVGNAKDRPNYIGKEKSWKFAVLTDSQGGQVTGPENIVTSSNGAPRIILDAAGKKLVEENVDLALFTGDLTNVATPQEFRGWLNAFDEFLEAGGKMYPVRGNHEFPNYRYAAVSDEIMMAKNEEKVELWKTYTGHLGPKDSCLDDNLCLSYSFVNENILFVGLDTYFYYNRPGRRAEYDVGMPEWDKVGPWLEKTFDQYAEQADRVVVFLHEPLFGRSYDKTGQINHGWKYIDALDNGVDDLNERLSSLFTDYEVTVYSGHDHQYSRSLIYPKGVESGKSFLNITSGNLSYKSYPNKVGYYPEFEQALSQDNFDPSKAEYDSELENAATIIVVEVEGKKTTQSYYRASHSLTHDDTLAGKTWDDPEWKLVDRFSFTTDATQKVVKAGDSYAMESSSKGMKGYYGSTAAILDGKNQTFDTVEAAGMEYSNPITGIAFSVEKGTRYNLSKLVSMSWYAKPDGSTETDIIQIDGLAQQDSSLLRYWGAAEVSPSKTDQSSGNSNHIMDSSQTDAYVLAFEVPAWAQPSELILSRLDGDKWEAAVEPDNFINGAYQSKYLNSKNLKANKAWGFDRKKNLLWAVLDREGMYALTRQ